METETYEMENVAAREDALLADEPPPVHEPQFRVVSPFDYEIIPFDPMTEVVE